MHHTFGPVYDIESRILILGSMPSVKSREVNFYYGHPQNRFWRVVSSVLGCDAPMNIEEKKAMLLSSGIALWDVIESCDIIGSSDSSIKNVIPNDINLILKNSAVRKIYANGTKAEELYNRYCLKETGVKIEKLPSTSPANAAWKIDMLAEAWSVIKKSLGSK